jgi:hypothetical protein
MVHSGALLQKNCCVIKFGRRWAEIEKHQCEKGLSVRHVQNVIEVLNLLANSYNCAPEHYFFLSPKVQK